MTSEALTLLAIKMLDAEIELTKAEEAAFEAKQKYEREKSAYFSAKAEFEAKEQP